MMMMSRCVQAQAELEAAKYRKQPANKQQGDETAGKRPIC